MDIDSGQDDDLENDDNHELQIQAVTEDGRHDPDSAPRPPKFGISVLRDPIPFIAEMRKTLFEVPTSIELKPEEFHQYWPYVDNIWVPQHRTRLDKKEKAIVDYYGCRLRRATRKQNRKDSNEESDGQPQRKRNKPTREGGTCRVRIKISKLDGLVPCYRVQRTGDQEHSHDLDHIDKVKRNSVIMDIARSEVMKGYVPSSVFNVLQEDKAKLEAIGGKFLNGTDVRNVSLRWRATYEGKLVPHPGYQHHSGNDISASLETSAAQATQALLSRQLQVQSASPPPPPFTDTLSFPIALSNPLTSYLPSSEQPRLTPQLPFVTLTYAVSLDSFLSLGPTIPTPISGPLSKAMTHHLRANHDAILVGVGTAIADDPTLNCRIEGAGGFGGLGWDSQPRPVIVDPTARWKFTRDSKVLAAARTGNGKSPWLIITPKARPDNQQTEVLTAHRGKYLDVPLSKTSTRFGWEHIFRLLAAEGIKSVMVEGGAVVINDLLRLENRHLIDAVVITLAPTYLGTGGVSVGPARSTDSATGNVVPALRFSDVKWLPMGEDVVMCGRLRERSAVAE